MKWFNFRTKQGDVPLEVKLPDNTELPGRLDPHSPTWRFVADWAGESLDLLSKELEKDLNEKQTARIRGEIKRLRQLIKLPEEVSRSDRLHNQPRQGIIAGGRISHE